LKLSACNWDFDLALDCSNSDCHLSSSNSWLLLVDQLQIGEFVK
jgi:hypothetical protein